LQVYVKLGLAINNHLHVKYGVLPENLIITQLAKKFVFYRNRRFIAVFRRSPSEYYKKLRKKLNLLLSLHDYFI